MSGKPGLSPPSWQRPLLRSGFHHRHDRLSGQITATATARHTSTSRPRSVPWEASKLRPVRPGETLQCSLSRALIASIVGEAAAAQSVWAMTAGRRKSTPPIGEARRAKGTSWEPPSPAQTLLPGRQTVELKEFASSGKKNSPWSAPLTREAGMTLSRPPVKVWLSESV
jgi:hypothetical protein